MGIQRILRLAEVKHVTGLSRTTIYRRMAEKSFPRQVHPSPNTAGWMEKDIQKWMESLVPQEDSPTLA